MIKVMIHGCNGRMGKMITELSENDDRIQIVAGVDALGGLNESYPVYEKVEDFQEEVDVIVDFSKAEAVDHLLAVCVEKKIPVVLCTTGLNKETLKKITEASKYIAILKSANMSLGINVLMKALQEIAKKLEPNNFDIEIVEKHHNQKMDAPSGTALALADSINDALENKCLYNYDRSQVRKIRDKKEIGISAVRGGSIPGEHEIIFAGLDEVITIKHTAYSRIIFGKGAILGACFLAGKEAGLYDMQDVME